MAEQTNISWADATINFWIGCTKVSPACDNCYAETWGNRFGVKWGPHEERQITKAWEAKIKAILRQAAKDGIDRPFVFVNSLSDFWDNAVDNQTRRAAFDLMRRYPQVTFLLLTKRPGNIVKMWEQIRRFSPTHASLDPDGVTMGGSVESFPRNVAIGCTVVNQDEASRDVPVLLMAKHLLRPAFAFLSMEPLLGPVDFSRIPWRFNAMDVVAPGAPVKTANALTGQVTSWDRMFPVEPGESAPKIDWVITGGESGKNARPAHPQWFRDLRDQCARAGVAFHHKQHGEWVSGAGRIGSDLHYFEDGVVVTRAGTKAAGRALDGVIHDARPEVRS